MPPKTPRKLRGEIPSTPKTALRNLTSPPVSSRLRSRLRTNERPVEEPSSPSKESKTPLPKDKPTLMEDQAETPIGRKTRQSSENRARTQPVNRVSKVVDSSANDAPKTTTRPRGRLANKMEPVELSEQSEQIKTPEHMDTAQEIEEPKQSPSTAPDLTSPPLVKRLRSRARNTEPRPTVTDTLSAKTPTTSKRGRRAATMETPAPVTRGRKEKIPKRNLIGDLVQSQEESDENKQDEISIVATLSSSKSIPLDVKSPFKPGTPEAKSISESAKKDRQGLFDVAPNSPLQQKNSSNTQPMEYDMITQESTSSMSVEVEAGSSQTTSKLIREVTETKVTETYIMHSNLNKIENVTEKADSIMQGYNREDTITSETISDQTSSNIAQPQNTFKEVTPKKNEPGVTTLEQNSPRVATPKQDTPRATTPKQDTPRAATPKQDTPRAATPKQDTPRVITPKQDTPRAAISQQDAPIAATPKEDTTEITSGVESDEEMEMPVESADDDHVPNELEPLRESEDSDSDDDAPEAISMSSGKSTALEAKRQEREAAQRLADQQKNKRRETDTKLKQQKAAKKTRAVYQKLPEVEFEMEDEESTPLEIPTTLPLDMLEMIADMDEAKPTKKPTKRGKHIRTEDFDKLEESSRQPKKTKGEKDIGSIKVVSLANQVEAKPVPESILDFKTQHFYGDRVKRKNAVLNMSQKRKVATKFRRS
ncbi:hypothetical protein K7432_011143 [Basidiobolus ranarum]|uniref:Uncharacterized protein n=1 Tax=Basidiobolus ranarum TaxID=34480 RepID=A0ABR2WMU2_9FUNG